MVSSGIRRKVDDLGRVVIPAGIRRTLGIREGDPVEVTVEGERVVLAKPRDACVFCGREEERLTPFRGRLVCRDCLGSLGEVEGRLRATDEAAAPAATDRPRDPATLPDWDAPPGPSRAPRTPGPAGRAPHRPAPAATPAGDAAPRPPATAPPHVPEDPGPAAGRREPDRPAPEAGADPTPAGGGSTHHDRDRAQPGGAQDGTEGEPPEHEPGHGARRRPPYDPASTTAW